MLFKTLPKSLKHSFYYTVLLASGAVFSQELPPVHTIKVSDPIYMLTGAGGNLGVSVGEDGIFVIDDQYAPMTEKIMAALKKLHPGKVGFVINTHWHGDHTGGNENMAKSGSVIVAHDNVRKRMSTEQVMKMFNYTEPAAPEQALPVITFSQDLSFYINGDQARVIHMPHAHTDGDAIIHFKNANVIHMGDVYFAGTFPFIDVSSGGNIDGVIDAINQALSLTNEQTKIIPGHGSLSNPKELIAYRDMLIEARQRVAPLIKDNLSLADIQQKKPLSDLVEKWGGGFIKEDAFVQIIVDSLSQN